MIWYQHTMPEADNRPWGRYLAIIATLHFLLHAALGLGRLWGGAASGVDAGLWNQAVGLYASGQTSLLELCWAGSHFVPMLVGFVPLYKLWPGPEWFFIASPLAITLAAWPVYRTCRLLGCEARTAFLWGLAYLFHPAVMAAEAWDFEPNMMATLFVALSAWATVAGRGRWLSLFLVCLGACKEQYGLAIAGFGCLWALRNRRWRDAIALVALGFALFALLVLVVIPRYSGGHFEALESRYGWLAVAFLKRPWGTLRSAFTAFEWITNLGAFPYTCMVILPLLGLPLAAPEFLVPALADLAPNFLSANVMPRSIFAYHSVAIAPLLVIAACAGAQRLAAGHALSALACGVTVMCGLILSPLPHPFALDLWEWRSLWNLPDPRVAEIQKLIGSEPAQVQANVETSFTQRRKMYMFPLAPPEFPVAVLHLANPRKKGAWRPHVFNQPFGGPVGKFLGSVKEALDRKDLGIVYWNDPWLVLRRGATDAVPRAEVQKAFLRFARDI
jgi:uncharacterized membrane protein